MHVLQAKTNHSDVTYISRKNTEHLNTGVEVNFTSLVCRSVESFIQAENITLSNSSRNNLCYVSPSYFLFRVRTESH